MPSPIHLLIAHDDEYGRFRIGRSLRASLHDALIFHAKDSKEALAMMARVAFDALVTGHRMTGLPGIELVRQLRARGSEIPILITSSDEHIAA